MKRAYELPIKLHWVAPIDQQGIAMVPARRGQALGVIRLWFANETSLSFNQAVPSRVGRSYRGARETLVIYRQVTSEQRERERSTCVGLA